MKKFFVTLGLAILVLTGCSQSQTKKTTTASSSSSSSVKKEVKMKKNHNLSWRYQWNKTPGYHQI